jgi:hypothetical protein
MEDKPKTGHFYKEAARDTARAAFRLNLVDTIPAQRFGAQLDDGIVHRSVIFQHVMISMRRSGQNSDSYKAR